MKRARIIVKGEVQMAHYRSKVKAIADDLGIVGEARNLKDGNVRIIAEGNDTKLADFIDRIRMKEYITDVQGMDVQYEEPTGRYIRFERKGEDIPDEDADMLTVMKSFDRKAEKMVGLMGSMDRRLGSIDDKQDQTIDIIREGNEKMLEKQDETIKVLGEKIDSGFGKMDNNFKNLGEKMDANFKNLGEKIDSGFGKMDNNFNRMDIKYDRMSERMESIDKTLQKLTEAILALVKTKS